MKLLATLVFLITAIVQLSAQKLDTLQYDHMVTLIDNGQQLVAVTKFPGEADVLFNMRFTPTQPCSLTAVLIAFGVVKFQPFSGKDTLIVLVYDAQENTQPWFVNVVQTYKVNLGDKGFPSPNVEEVDPLGAASRDVLNVPVNPPVLISPKRDMIVAVKLISSQRMKVGDGEWNGFSLLMKYQIPDPDYKRYRRYQIGNDLSGTKNNLAIGTGYAGMWIRPIVKYDPSLPPVILTDVDHSRKPRNLLLSQNFPNPFNSATTVSYNLPFSGHASLNVYDNLGREIKTFVNQELDAGTYSVQLDLSDLVAGTYYLRLLSGNTMITRSITVLK